MQRSFRFSIDEAAINQLLSGFSGRLKKKSVPISKAITGQIKGATKGEFRPCYQLGQDNRGTRHRVDRSKPFCPYFGKKGGCPLQLAPFDESQNSDPFSWMLFIKEIGKEILVNTPAVTYCKVKHRTVPCRFWVVRD